MRNNSMLEYYQKEKISPVVQNISDWELHIKRRKKLYRQCGIPAIAFKDAKIVEIGPGGGYNTLAFFEWGAKHVDLVEPNRWGIDQIEKLFAKHNISKRKYTIHNTRVEEFNLNNKYDIVIAEGFLQHMENQDGIIDCLKRIVGVNGVIVITCTDEISFFVERAKRMIANALVKEISTDAEKVMALLPIFETQLRSLRGMSRSAKDWCYDQLLCKAISNNVALSIGDAIVKFGKTFDVLGTSPNIFCDYSWYKDVYEDIHASYSRQFIRKRASLLLAGMAEVELVEEDSNTIFEAIKRFTALSNEYETSYNQGLLEDMIVLLISLDDIMKRIPVMYPIYTEIIMAIKELTEKGKIDFKNYPKFFRAFGRSMQYVAFQKV